MSETNRKNILILDPERDVSDLFARALEANRGFKCYMASTEEDALDLLRDISFGLLLLDMNIASAGGFGLLKRIKRLFPGIVIIIDAYLHQKDRISEALALGASGFIFKPIKIDSFREKIDQFCRVALG
jgi:two-component system CitB family response regulator